MSTNKRRKLDVNEPPQAMSAFALRKRLLSQQATPALAKADTAEDTNKYPSTADVIEPSGSRSSKKARKGPSPQSAPGHENELDAALKGSLPGALSTDDYANINSNDIVPRSHSPTPEDEVSLEPVEPVKRLPLQLSNFKPSRSNYKKGGDGRLVLKLSDGERLVILGNYGVHVTSGEVTINGATLTTSEKIHWVNAAHCHALPVIRCSDTATLELLPHSGIAGLRSLANLSPQFRRLWNESTSSNGNAASSDPAFQILYTSADGPKKTALQDLVSPPEWNREIAKLVKISQSKPCSVIITGPKSSGKSTFGKILTNRLITDRSSDSKRRAHREVAVLDLDPGQPEYCVAGQVALVRLTGPVLGPSFCRPLGSSEVRVVRSHALASVSPASDPELYLEAAMDLMTRYRNTLGSYPLVINTPGWIQGTGLDLLMSLIGSLRPTEVVYMSESGPAEVVEALRESCKVSSFSTLPSQASQLTSRTAAHLRSMQTMSYFHAETIESPTRWNASPLTTMPPWQVSYLGPNRGVFGVMCYDYQAPLDLLADAINGTVVAMVGVENTKAFRCSTEHVEVSTEKGNNAADHMMDIDDKVESEEVVSPFTNLAQKIISTTPEGIPIINTADGTTLDPRYSRSIGLALVRGIDIENGVLQLLTPLPLESIESFQSGGEEIVLVSGKFDTPSWAYTEGLYYRAGGEGDDGTDAEEPVETIDDMQGSGDFTGTTDATPAPWIEALHGNQKRGAGSKVWRVRRDLGRAANATG
ncbi:hypothetical protein F4818DRAFT_433726 [Hypoxylon cercidicola]|nr:hypothetical protein F4818DRAFT_433726 [Hypoxylon cercidicola]